MLKPCVKQAVRDSALTTGSWLLTKPYTQQTDQYNHTSPTDNALQTQFTIVQKQDNKLGSSEYDTVWSRAAGCGWVGCNALRQKRSARSVCSPLLEVHVSDRSQNFWRRESANSKFKLALVDIRAAFLQSRAHDRDVFVEPPSNIKKPEI